MKENSLEASGLPKNSKSLSSKLSIVNSGDCLETIIKYVLIYWSCSFDDERMKEADESLKM